MAGTMPDFEVDGTEQSSTSDELLEAVIVQAEDIALRGFNLMEEHAAQGFQDEEDLACLQQAVDNVFQKVQEKVFDNLTRWAEYCESLSSEVQAAKPVMVPSSTGAKDSATFTASCNELRQELIYWRAILVAQEQKAAELSEELKFLETELLEAKQLEKIDSASNPTPLWRVSDLSEAMARLNDTAEPGKQVQEFETPGARLPKRPVGPSRLGSVSNEPENQLEGMETPAVQFPRRPIGPSMVP